MRIIEIVILSSIFLFVGKLNQETHTEEINSPQSIFFGLILICKLFVIKPKNVQENHLSLF